MRNLLSFFFLLSARRTARARRSAGLTLIETLVASAVFAVFSLVLYQLYAQVVQLSTSIRMRTLATEIAGEQFELVRNLQYYDVGTVGGIPAGVVDGEFETTRGGATFTVHTTIRNVDHPEDGTLGGSPGDLSPADNKLVEVAVECASCATPAAVSFTSWIAPKSLETENGNGALVIRAIDANGQPIAGAAVTIQNDALSPAVDISDVTDATGVLTIVDAPPSAEAYEITVGKSGYSSESTYAPGGVGNPNPLKPHLTTIANTVTQSTFSIDRLATLQLLTADALCEPIGAVSGTLSGTKLIGSSPDVLKHSYSFTTAANGTERLSTVEWDTYLFALTGSAYDLAGINPLQPLTVPPGSDQNVTLTLRPSDPNALLVAVTDAATGLAIAGAEVRVEGEGVDETELTSIGSLAQTDWSGGGGQQSFADAAGYWSDSGSMDVSSTAGEVTLAPGASSGELTSSTFDIGAGATFHQLSWFPLTQPPAAGATPVRFQIATNDEDLPETVWTFLGPDGSASSYYDAALSDIASAHDGHRYLRYRLFLSTDTIGTAPALSDASFTFTSSCLPPGQTSFAGLPDGSYTVTASKDGYATDEKTITISADASTTFILSPS